jgi:hypothetical protein
VAAATALVRGAAKRAAAAVARRLPWVSGENDPVALLEADHRRFQELLEEGTGTTDTHDIVLEGYQEHHVADLIIRELRRLAKDDEKWGAKFKVLEERASRTTSKRKSAKCFPPRAAC